MPTDIFKVFDLPWPRCLRNQSQNLAGGQRKDAEH
jgi:hypothetical protein